MTNLIASIYDELDDLLKSCDFNIDKWMCDDTITAYEFDIWMPVVKDLQNNMRRWWLGSVELRSTTMTLVMINPTLSADHGSTEIFKFEYADPTFDLEDVVLLLYLVYVSDERMSK